MSIVDEQAAVRHALTVHSIAFDGLFAARQADAESAREALEPYLTSAIGSEPNQDRRDDLRSIRANIKDYTWHCGGFKRAGDNLVFCVFVRTGAGGKFFPEIKDGGINVCSCVFDLRDRRIDQLAWNGKG